MTCGFFPKADLATAKHPVKWLTLNRENKTWEGELKL